MIIEGSSTVHAFVELMNQLYTTTDAAKNFAHVLLLDYTKAFDIPDYSLFMQKLRNVSIADFLIKWLAVFLGDCSWSKSVISYQTHFASMVVSHKVQNLDQFFYPAD